MTRRLRIHPRVATMALAAAIVLGSGGTARADTCFQQLRDCAVRAAAESSYWRAVVATFECELDFLNCVRIEIVGR
jgi:hypothetical protein